MSALGQKLTVSRSELKLYVELTRPAGERIEVLRLICRKFQRGQEGLVDKSEQLMKQKILRARAARLPLATAICAVAGLMALASQAKAVEVSGNAALTTDYVWRGSTQTQGDPAVQAGFKVAGNTGLYMSIWGSNVEFAPETHASSEFDFTVGWGRKLSNDWAVDVNILYYRYPSTTVDLNWTELNGTVTYADNYWLSVGYSPEALGSSDTGVYTQLGARFPVTGTLRVEGAIAHFFLDYVNDRSYSHAQLSAIWALRAPFELRLTAHGTDSNAKQIFGEDFAGSRVEAALQANF